MSRPYPCVYCTEDGYCKKFSDEEVVSWCVQGPCKDEKPSNADRIRAMSDEELAEWISKHDCHTNLYGYDPKDAILDWLKEEIEDDTDRE